jgi:hypothetical protein
MRSLKSSLPVISELTGLSETALYERQRALVRLGLLPTPTKTGRNSGGAMATPGSVAILLVSVMVTDKLSEIDERVLEFLQLKTFNTDKDWGPGWPSAKEDNCHFTGERTFYGALSAVLRGAMVPPTVDIEIIRQRKLARLIDRHGQVKSSDFSQEPFAYEREDLLHLVRFKGIDQLRHELDFEYARQHFPGFSDLSSYVQLPLT